MNFSYINVWINLATIIFIVGGLFMTVRYHSRQIKELQEDARVSSAKVAGIEITLTSGMARIEQKVDDIKSALNIKHRGK